LVVLPDWAGSQLFSGGGLLAAAQPKLPMSRGTRSASVQTNLTNEKARNYSWVLHAACNNSIEHYFAVPGDFNLVLLDQLLTNSQLKLIGCCNELNAGYAADGYARASIAAVVVTGVGPQRH